MTTPKEEQKHTDLRECPFCLNGEGEIKRGYEHGSMLYFTRCVAHINPKHVIAAYGITQADADIAWNTRFTRNADCHEELVSWIKNAHQTDCALLLMTGACDCGKIELLARATNHQGEPS